MSLGLSWQLSYIITLIDYGSMIFPYMCTIFFLKHASLYPIFSPKVYVSCDANFSVCFSWSMVQMLTSKDTNFIGFTYKKSDVLKSMQSSGKLLRSLAAFLWYLHFLVLSFV